MTVKRVNIRDLGDVLKRDFEHLEKRISGAIKRTAERAAKVVADAAPLAWGELKHSVHVEPTRDGARIVASAPHAGRVENGTPPGTFVDLDKLTAWVIVKGIADDEDVARSIARRVQHKILREGVAPTFFVLGTVPEVMALLHDEIGSALKEI